MWALISGAWAGCLVVQGGSVWDGERAVPADLIAVDGRIAAVGEGLGVAAQGDRATWKGRTCDRVALPAGAWVVPGLVEVGAPIGVAEISGERQTVDHRGEGDPVRAALVVADAFNPRSVHVPVMRLGGITGAVVAPEGGRIAGQAAWVRLAGATQAHAIVSRSVAMVASLDGGSRAQALLELRELIEDARAYAANQAAFERNQTRAFASGASRPDLDALVPVARGELPLLISADRAADLEAIARFADEARVRVVIRGAAEGWLVADLLAKAKIPVIVDPLVYGPGGFGATHGRADNPKRLAEAGVLVVISAYPGHNAPTLAQVAGNAVRAGMSRADALNAITRAPAKAFGMDDRGALEVGSAADWVAFSGDPLELASDVLQVVVDGAPQPLRSRQTALHERYSTLPGTPLPGLAPR